MNKATSLTTGRTQIGKRKRHGIENNPAYSVWSSMRRRCRDPKRDNYAYYGGRGIKVCDRWLNSFANFLEDMGERPSPKHSIDRIDNDGNYSPQNCQWVTHQEQCMNRRPRLNKSGFKGVYKNARCRTWSAEIVRLGKHYRLGNYLTPEEANLAVMRFENGF